MEEQKISLTINQLESLLNQQKEMVIDKLSGQSSYYNLESDAGNSRTLPIDKDKFKLSGMQARYPNEFEVLKKYIK